MSISSSSLEAIGVLPRASAWTITTKNTYEVRALRLRRISMDELWPACGHRRLRAICHKLEACYWQCDLVLTVNVYPSKLSAQFWSANSGHKRPMVERREVCIPSGEVVMCGRLLRLRSRRTHRQDSHRRGNFQVVSLGDYAVESCT